MKSRLRPVLVAVVLLGMAAVLAAAAPSLKELYDAHQWFRLRDAVSHDAHAPDLYRGAVAYAFNDRSAARKMLQRIVDRAPGSDDGIEARSLLISLAQLDGDYRQALAEIRALESIVKDASGLANGDAFFSAIADFPKQAISSNRPATVRYNVKEDNLFIPASINGKPAQCLVDTGANFSTIGEGDARAFGLAIRDAPGAHGTDAAGTRVPFRMAYADRLSVGGFEVRNVTFLVARDDQQPFVALPPGSRVVLGIPVLLSFGSIRWHADGRFDVGVKTVRGPRGKANLCFDGANVYAVGEYQGHPIDVFIDTGASKNRLSARFAADFPEAVRNVTPTDSKIGGLGGSIDVRVAVLKNVAFHLGGRNVVLQSVESVLDTNPGGQPDRFHLWAGYPLMAQSKTVTIDFRSMNIVLE